MVNNAIKGLKERGGSSLQAIKSSSPQITKSTTPKRSPLSSRNI
ncbi:unnamed protein product [Tenebrio molitor]|nr:unnamed protein product [Tenebrio molitor]